jgi:hypothetical protein
MLPTTHSQADVDVNDSTVSKNGNVDGDQIKGADSVNGDQANMDISKDGNSGIDDSAIAQGTNMDMVS